MSIKVKTMSVILLLIMGLIIWKISAGNDAPLDQWRVSNEANTTTIDHTLWQQTLDEFLISSSPSGVNLVDYQAIVEEGKPALSTYLKAMSATNIIDFAKKEQFAYWINVYNALTLHLISENYPVDSITDIPGGLAEFGPWDNPAITVLGESLSLNDIEHRILRPIWADHRIHFAVNCASIGCPNLQPQAFSASNLQALLGKSAQQFLAHDRGIQINQDSITLSSIFEWYSEDFGENETQILDTISEYLEPDQQQKIKANTFAIQYQYDWRLNDDQ